MGLVPEAVSKIPVLGLCLERQESVALDRRCDNRGRKAALSGPNAGRDGKKSPRFTPARESGLICLLIAGVAIRFILSTTSGDCVRL